MAKKQNERIREIEDLPQEWEEAWAAHLISWNDIKWATYNDVTLEELILFHSIYKRRQKYVGAMIALLLVILFLLMR